MPLLTSCIKCYPRFKSWVIEHEMCTQRYRRTVCVGMQEISVCVCVCVYTGRLTAAFTNRVSPSCRLWGWGGGIGVAPQKSGEINRRSEGLKEMYSSRHGGQICSNLLLLEEGRGINKATLFSGWDSTAVELEKLRHPTWFLLLFSLSYLFSTFLFFRLIPLSIPNIIFKSKAQVGLF